MDAVKALRQIHKEFTECTLCTDQYESPKMLPCQHTFCLRCLESYGVGKKIGEAVACPVCRQEFVLQKGGFSALPNNFNTNRIIELQKSFEKTHDDAKWCHMCKDDEKEGAVCMTPATGYCSSCSKGVCKECASKHTKDGHTVEIAAAVLSPNSTAKPFSGLCSEHSGELLKLFCVECSTVVCVKCFCRSHNTHKCCDIEEAAEKFGVELEAQLKTMRVTASKMKHLTDRYSRKIQLFSENTERMEHAIKETAEKLKRSVDASKTALIRELKEKTEPTLAQMRNYKKLLDERSLTINCLLDESEKAKSSGNPVKIIKLSNKIKTDVAGFDIPSSSGEAIQKQYYFFPASFNSSSTPAKSLVGCIIECDAELEDEEENESDGEEAVSVNSYNSGRGSLLRFDALELEPSEGSIDCDDFFEIPCQLTTCTRCGWNHDVTMCKYPECIRCFRCGGAHHIRICGEVSMNELL